jgi:hypothetical protein
MVGRMIGTVQHGQLDLLKGAIGFLFLEVIIDGFDERHGGVGPQYLKSSTLLAEPPRPKAIELSRRHFRTLPRSTASA